MRILIDIGHPAHVHYFKNFIRIMKSNGHEFFVTARDKEITHELLNHYEIPYTSRGKGGKSLFGKLFYIFKADLFIYRKSLKFKPDLFLSFASTYAAHASKLYGKPHIALDDTEHAKFELFLYPPCTNIILTPKCFKKNLGKKQIRFDSFMELSYLDQNYFSPDKKVFEKLGLQTNERFAIIRFVSWNASHDFGTKGLSNSDKIKLVRFLAKKLRVFVSSEGEMPEELKEYKFNIPVYKMHDALYFASIYIGEGGTTASEAALLGTPSIYINDLSMGYIEEEINAGLLIKTTNYEEIEKNVEELLTKSKNSFKENLSVLLENKIDLTKFLVSFISNYPNSIELYRK